MDKPVCPKCGNDDVKKMTVGEAGPHNKLVCNECTSYIKFVSKKQTTNLIMLGVNRASTEV